MHQIFDGFPPSAFLSLSSAAATSALRSSSPGATPTDAESLHVGRALTRHGKSKPRNSSGSRSRHGHHHSKHSSGHAQSRSPSTGRTPTGRSPHVPGHPPTSAEHAQAVTSSRSSSTSPSPTPGMNAEYKHACSTLNTRRAGGRKDVRIAVSGGTKKTEERIACLGVLGWDLDEDGLEREICRFVQQRTFTLTVLHVWRWCHCLTHC